MASPDSPQRMYDRTRNPTDKDLITFITNPIAIKAWTALITYLETHYDLTPQIIYYGDRYGWLKRYRKGTRTIVSLFPEKDSFSVLIVYGQKEIQKFTAQEPQFTSIIVDIFHKTKKLHDGKWLWIPITDSTNLEDLKQLIAIKRKPRSMQNLKPNE